MTSSSLNTAFATLDCANARNNLEDARSDPRKLRQVLTDCFFDGSAAACEAAAHFILSITHSSTTALEVADILKSLPTAIPPRNAPALAQLCAFLASSFPEEECGAPLNTFCYAESRVKQIAVKAVISRVEETAHLSLDELSDVLHRTRSFFTEIFRGVDDFYDRLVAVRGLVGIGSMHPGATRETVLSFLLQLGSDDASLASDAKDSPFEHEYESFLASELVAMATDSESLSKIVTRCLVRALDCGVASTVQELWTAQNSKVNSVVPIIGHDVFLYILTSIAATNACQGRISVCRDLLLIVRTILTKQKTSTGHFNPVICSVISSICVAIASMCSTAGAHDVAKHAAGICKLLQGSLTSNTGGSFGEVLESLQLVCREAVFWKCGNAVLSLGLLRQLLTFWHREKVMKYFIDGAFSDLLDSEGFQDVTDNNDSLMDAGTTRSSLSRLAPVEMSHEPTSLSPSSGDQPSPLLVTTSLLLALLSHPHAQVRYAAAKAMTKVRSSPSMLFFLPAVITRLRQETNGVVVTLCLHDVLLSPCLLAHQETGKIVMKTILQLMRPSEGTNATDAYHSSLVAIAGAAKTAPGISASVLLAEVEKLKSSFDSLRPSTKAAACAAVLKITALRPTRGASFVPFIMQCTTKEAMESAPEAAALCFEVIYLMAENEVLDAVKAVKVMLKTFPDILTVDAVARRSFLRLLGCVANRSSSKKGAVIAAKVIGFLRNCLVNLLPKGECLQSRKSDAHLSWDQVDEAALALAEYSTDEILRIGYAHQEPLDNPSEEDVRLKAIASECMEFMHNLLSATGRALFSKNDGAPGLQKLLVTIAKHEWDNRQRSSFDPDRIAKLRATSEALRRARQKTQTANSPEGSSNAPATEEDRPTGQFVRAVSTLPAGVIKALCARCAPARKMSGEEGDNEGAEKNARAVSMRVLREAGALSPALPWVGLTEDVLQSSLSATAERAAALCALAYVEDDGFETSQARMKWFGARHCGGLLGENGKMRAEEREETKQAFVGMVLHQIAEVEKMFHGLLYHTATSGTIAIFIDALADAGNVGVGLVAAVKTVLQAICQPGMELDAASEKRFADGCLSRLDPDAMRSLLIESVPSPSAVRLACATGDYVLLRACANAFANGAGEDDGEECAAAVRKLGEALRRMPFEQRRAVLQDLLGRRVMGKPIGAEVVANCLGTAVLLPDERGSLQVASCVCGRAERGKVGAIVQRLIVEMDGGEMG